VRALLSQAETWAQLWLQRLTQTSTQAFFNRQERRWTWWFPGCLQTWSPNLVSQNGGNVAVARCCLNEPQAKTCGFGVSHRLPSVIEFICCRSQGGCTTRLFSPLLPGMTLLGGGTPNGLVWVNGRTGSLISTINLR